MKLSAVLIGAVFANPLQIENEIKSPEDQIRKHYEPIPVVVIACNRPTVSRALGKSLFYFWFT